MTLPETTPVNEVIETAYALEDRVGVRLGPLVVNGVDHPSVPLPAARELARRAPGPTRRSARCSSTRPGSAAPASTCRRPSSSGCAATSPLEQWHLPLLPVAGMGAGDVAELATALRAPRVTDAGRRWRRCSTAPT